MADEGAPPLTFPEREAEAVRATYAAAGVILEYGSGGSTLLAAGMPGKTVLSVESDPAWAAKVRRAAAGAVAKVVVRHADIGPVRAWGKPVSRAHAHRFHTYPLAIWSDPEFAHPDLVLIDGRFRRACFATVAVKIERPVTVLFDDYRTRPQYAEVERLAAPVEFVGRMARFELAPGPVPKEHFDWIVGTYLEPDYARASGLVRTARKLFGGVRAE